MAPKKSPPKKLAPKKKPSGKITKSSANKANVTRKPPSGDPKSPRRLRSGATLLPTAANPLAKKKSPKKKAAPVHSNRSSAASTKVHTGHSNRSSAVSPSVPRPRSPNYSPQPGEVSTARVAETPFGLYNILLENLLEIIDEHISYGEIEYDEKLEDFIEIIVNAKEYLERQGAS